MKILKINNNSSFIEIVPKIFFKQVLSSYSLGIAKNLWKNYSIHIGNKKKGNDTYITFYKTNFLYPVIKIKYYRINNKEYIEVNHNAQKIILCSMIELSFWFKNYFLDKAKI